LFSTLFTPGQTTIFDGDFLSQPLVAVFITAAEQKMSFGQTASLVQPPLSLIFKREQSVRVPDDILSIEPLYRYNVLYSRAKLLKHCSRSNPPYFTDDDLAGMIQRDLNQHCGFLQTLLAKHLPEKKPARAIEDYHAIRARASWIFGDIHLKDMTLMMIELDTMQSKFDKLAPQSDEAHRIGQQIQMIKERIENSFSGAKQSGILKQELSMAKQRLSVRLAMALGGGFALVIPMLIMVLHPSKITNLVTTASFVLVVAVGLAVVMTSSEPKDIVACTAAYAAVLVVFVGAGGGA
jgi:hypothetical protein